MKSEIKVYKIKKGNKLPDINLTPIGSWMITTAFIEPENSLLFAGGTYAPTFMNMQQVIAKGPAADNAKVGDWVYIDMSRFVKTVKTKGKVVVGVGGQEHVTEKLVPPVFVAPGGDVTYFKINDREIEGVIDDINKLNKEYSTIEDFAIRQEEIQKESNMLKEAADKGVVYDLVESNAPAIHGANSGGRKRK